MPLMVLQINITKNSNHVFFVEIFIILVDLNKIYKQKEKCWFDVYLFFFFYLRDGIFLVMNFCKFYLKYIDGLVTILFSLIIRLS